MLPFSPLLDTLTTGHNLITVLTPTVWSRMTGWVVSWSFPSLQTVPNKAGKLPHSIPPLTSPPLLPLQNSGGLIRTGVPNSVCPFSVTRGHKGEWVKTKVTLHSKRILCLRWKDKVTYWSAVWTTLQLFLPQPHKWTCRSATPYAFFQSCSSSLGAAGRENCW